jgi:hypothetical protein
VDSVSRGTGRKWTGRWAGTTGGIGRLHLLQTIVTERFPELARPALMRAWQAKWDSADTGRFAHSIFPDVTLRPWFEGQKEDKSFVCTLSRILFGHCSVRSHLCRFRIVEDLMCVCVRVIMRQWTTWFGTVKDSGWKDIILLVRLPRWMWVLGSPFVICVHWRSGVPWSVAWTSLEGLE